MNQSQESCWCMYYLINKLRNKTIIDKLFI